MKRLKLFEEFKGKIAEEADIVYRDKNMLVIVPKTLQASKRYSRNTNWCSIDKGGFYGHYPTANLFRFHFKDGYKIRLTWDYLPWDGHSYTAGTHWGQGGWMKGEDASYQHIRPKDEENPFDFDYHKNDYKQFMVNRILSIPEEAKKKIIEYQKSHSHDKTDVINKMHSEIRKIEIIDVKLKKDREYCIDLNLTLKSGTSTNEIELTIYDQSGRHRYDFSYLGKIDLGGAESYTNSGLEEYLFDKTMQWLKSNDMGLYDKIKSIQVKKTSESIDMNSPIERDFDSIKDCVNHHFDLIGYTEPFNLNTQEQTLYVFTMVYNLKEFEKIFEYEFNPRMKDDGYDTKYFISYDKYGDPIRYYDGKRNSRICPLTYYSVRILISESNKSGFQDI